MAVEKQTNPNFCHLFNADVLQNESKSESESENESESEVHETHFVKNLLSPQRIFFIVDLRFLHHTIHIASFVLLQAAHICVCAFLIFIEKLYTRIHHVSISIFYTIVDLHVTNNARKNI